VSSAFGTDTENTPPAPATPVGSGGRAAPLELSPEQFRGLGHQLVERIASLLESLAERPVAPNARPAQVRAALGAERPLPAGAADPAAILDEATRLLLASSTFNGHPRFFGYITSSAAPLGVLGELLAAGVNPNVGAWALSPLASEIERQTVRWIAELLAFPTDCGGLLVSGGNMANMVCAFAALRAAAPWDVRASGIAGSSHAPLAIYATGETHTWVDKFADLCGLGTHAIRRVPADADGRMRGDALRAAIVADKNAGAIPGFVIGSAGTVSTGAIDPLDELATICAEHGVWFHVDGAYGAPAAALPHAPAELKALSRAHSVAVDPHKWLYAPIEAGCVLVRDAEALRTSFSFRPPYYHFEGSAEDPPTNFFEWGPQNTRGFKALKVWLGIRQAGRDGIVASIADDIALARRMYQQAGEYAELEPLTCGLSITTFRYVPPELREQASEPGVQEYLNELNQAVLTAVQESGEAYPSNAVIEGKYAIRACIVNFRTTAADVDALPEIVVRHGRAVHGRMRVARGA
jgi:glutamate/tyrosine decarboxylase-like PLP-dependent enzyme